MKLMNSLSIKKCIWILIGLIFLTDLAILLDIPYIRQILGFLFLTFLPGLLILQILKLNKLGYTEKFVLTVGLSISFLMFFGLLLNNLSLALGYETPLSTVPLLVSFNLAAIALILVAYRMNKDAAFSRPNIELSTSEKAFLIVPVMFPALSIFGTYFMNTTNNNIILMFLLFLIPIYVTFVCIFNHKFPARIYPLIICLIGISLILIKALRVSHILGIDAHTEYYLFQSTLDNQHWVIFEHITYEACLSISLLPTIYQLFINVNPEIFFNVFYILLFSLAPLVVFVISKKYVGDFYGFLASIFFMFQARFIFATGGARTNVAILFFGLAMMTLFSDRIDPLKKRILFIVFMASCIVSHYSTAYIFFFILLGTFIGIEILSKKYTVKKVISLTIVLLFFALIFFWYSQVTETAFNAGVGYIENTLTNLNKFFIMESRMDNVQTLFGEGVMQKKIPSKITFIFTWLTFVFIGIGVVTLIRRYKEMSFPELNSRKPDFLKDKFEVGYFLIALACAGLLVAFVALPFISKGYGIDRLYAVAITILSVFFVIGGIALSKNLSFIKQTFKKSLIKNLSFKKNGLPKTLFARKKLLRKNISEKKNKKCFASESVGGKNGSEVRAYFIILLVLIPYFLCVSGVMYQVFGVPQAIILNSEGEQYDRLYVHDQECYGAKWLKVHGEDKTRVYTDFWGKYRLISQSQVSFTSNSIDRRSLLEHKKIKGYIYLRYYNVVNGKLTGRSSGTFYNYNLTEYDDVFIVRNRIYNNDGSEVYG